MTTAQNNTKGILFILIGMVVFSIQDALIKFIYEDSALYELYLGRTLSAAFFLFCYMKFTKQKFKFKTHYPFLTTLRIICFFFGFSFFYISLTYMSLAMANALFFSSPFFVSLFSKTGRNVHLSPPSSDSLNCFSQLYSRSTDYFCLDNR